MEQAATIDDFLEQPIDRWVALRTTLVWCKHPALCGGVVWGRPSEGDVHALLRVFAAYDKLADPFDVLLDGRRIVAVDPDPLVLLVGWLGSNRTELTRRVRLQIGVIDHTVVGVTMAGILPVLGETHRFRIVRNPEEGFQMLAPDIADELCGEVEDAVARATGEPQDLQELRARLRLANGSLTLERAARELHVSTRTLQRALQRHGTSFQDEVRVARFAVAESLLTTTDEKIAAIASRLEVSEGVLTRIIRDQTGMTPGDLRRKSRAASPSVSPPPLRHVAPPTASSDDRTDNDDG